MPAFVASLSPWIRGLVIVIRQEEKRLERKIFKNLTLVTDVYKENLRNINR